MSVGAVTQVELRTTPTAPSDMRAALARAYEKVKGSPAPEGVVDALYAQSALETGRGASMVNFNFGGIKGAGPSGMTTRARTFEVIGGERKTIVDGFRAYGSLDEGAEDYVRLLDRRFSSAMSEAQRGNLDGFAHELKRANYYTASETDYARALHAMAATKDAPTPAAAAHGPHTSHVTASDATLASSADPSSASAEPAQSDFANAEQLMRVLDAMNASTLRILSAGNES